MRSRWLEVAAGCRVVLGASLGSKPGPLGHGQLLASGDRQVDLFFRHLQELEEEEQTDR